MDNTEKSTSESIQDIHNRINGTDWLQIELIAEYNEMLGGKLTLLSINLNYSCKLNDKEKIALENSKSEIVCCSDFDEQDEIISYVASYYAIPKENVTIVNVEQAKDHFD